MIYEFRGSIPSGWFISSPQDMARWIGIQLGVVEDIPEIFHALIPRSHEGDKSVVRNGAYYAAGWIVDSDLTFIRHAGGNPAFATNLTLFPEEQIGIVLLSNSSSTNVSMIHGIRDILDGNTSQTYRRGSIQITDMIATFSTVIVSILAVLFFILGLNRRKSNKNYPLTKRRVSLVTAWVLLTIIIGVSSLIIPTMFGFGWTFSLVWWFPYSILAARISLPLLSASITWFVYSKRTE